jgi:hypothetical protein
MVGQRGGQGHLVQIKFAYGYPSQYLTAATRPAINDPL